MICSKCSADIPDNSKFCPQCAAPQSPPAPTPSVRTKTPWWVPALVVLCISMGLYIFYQGGNNISGGKPSGGILTAATNLVSPPQPHSIQIAQSAVTVKALAYSWYQFTVPADVTSVSVNGRFTASGGMGNDIIVYVLDSDGFANFQNNHPATTYYNSGKLTQGSIAANLPTTPGTYYLVFDNRFSLLTPKAVEVNATLGYMK